MAILEIHDLVLELVDEARDSAICTECYEVAHDVELDSDAYAVGQRCESCGALAVRGADALLQRWNLAIDFVIPADDGTSTHCVICDSKLGVDSDGIREGSHNAYPVADGRCCEQCYDTIVMAERLRQAFETKGGSNG